MALSGKAGQVANANGASQIREWTLGEVAEALEITNFGSFGWREFLVGLQSATGTLTALGGRPTTGATATDLQLDVDSTSGSLRLEAPAILNGVETSTPVDGIVEHAVEFTINGILIITTVP